MAESSYPLPEPHCDPNYLCSRVFTDRLISPSPLQGKRKKSSRKPAAPRKKEPLPTTFSCLFCNHENCVIVKLDKKLGLGNLSCKICGQRFQTGINYLSAAVDVYSDWVDACDAVAKDAAAGNAVETTARGANEGSSGPVRREAEREELDQSEVGLDDY
ncbi:hypothetical protein RJZ56_005497 [Blastomyces dermatitidis]